MKESINTQSQNEVKELLDGYIVAPLRKNISETHTQIKQNIASSEDAVKSKIDKVPSAITETIRRLQNKLDKSFHFDDDEDAFDTLLEEINESIEACGDEIKEKLERIISDYSKTQYNKLEAELTNKKNEIKEQTTTSISNGIERLNNLLHDSEERFDKQFKNIDQSIKAKADEATESADSRYEAYKLAITNSHNSVIQALERVEGEIRNDCSEWQKHFDSAAQKIYSSLENNNKALQCTESQIGELINQKFKALFTATLPFGIINTIGIVIMIIFLLLK